ncbi:MAG: hypothetical protein ACRYGG_18520 [Janthinobacterium lividum]
MSDPYIVGCLAAQFTPFDGTRNPRVISEYVRNVRLRFLETYEQQRLLIAMLVKHEAATWLDIMCKDPAYTKMSGADLLALIKKTFYPVNYEDAAIRALQNLKCNGNLEKFLSDFVALRRELPTDAISNASLRVILQDGVGEPIWTREQTLWTRE